MFSCREGGDSVTDRPPLTGGQTGAAGGVRGLSAVTGGQPWALRGPLASYQRRPPKATPRQHNAGAAWESPAPAALYSAAAR